MGAGSYNKYGKNYGGMHTSDGKKQSSSPYSNAGYIKKTHSHKDYKPGSVVNYIGSEKNKHALSIPSGQKGVVIKKNNLRNPLMKSSRSQILVDFGDKGTHYVNKNVIQLTSDYSDSIRKQLSNTRQGVQSHRNPHRGNSPSNEEKIANTLDNRLENKRFREWRKEFLNKKQLLLSASVEEMTKSPEYSRLKDERKSVKDALEKLETLYNPTEEPVKKSEYIQSVISPEVSIEQAETMYTIKKEGDLRMIKMLKQSIMNINEKFKETSNELSKLTTIIDSRARDYFRNECSSPFYYNQMLQKEWNKENGIEMIEKSEVESDDENKDETKVTTTDAPKETFNQRLLLWGLYPRDVAV